MKTKSVLTIQIPEDLSASKKKEMIDLNNKECTETNKTTAATTTTNDINKMEEAATVPKPRAIFGIRHLQCFLLFCCLTVAYALRVNLSVAIVAMTDKAAANPNFPDYDWDEKAKSLVLSSFFWGYVVTQVPGGQLAEKCGAKVLLFWGILICSCLNILTPVCAAYGGWKLLCGLRVIQGLCQGMVFPCTHTLLSKWAPVEERGRLGTYCYAGSQFGTVIMLASSGVIASSALGWPSIFYTSGAAGVLWAIGWFFFGANNPSEYKTITSEEKQFIEQSLGQSEDSHRTPLITPWKRILTSLPFYSLLIVHCAHNWGFWTLLTELPSYMKNVLGMDIKKNALLSALPYLVMCLLSFFFSFLADVLSKRECISLSVSRKLFNSIGHWVPMIALIGLGYMTKEETHFAIMLLTICVGINSATYLGFQVNHIDLAPNFAGTLMGITNCFANIMSIIAPLIVGFVVSNESDPNQWRIVFFIASGIYFFGNLMFLLFGKVEPQPWNFQEGPSNTFNVNVRRRSSILVEAVGSHN